MHKAGAKKPREDSASEKAFAGMRILICGKGGSGKSSFVTLFSMALADKQCQVVVLDGDASNPGGLARLLFGLKTGPDPLIEFFGGRKHVECPVDDPSPLTRSNDISPITEKNIDLSEIPSSYFIQKGNITLFQVGKIQEACEGCDGPMSKINRDFVVKGDYVTLIDVEAGIEHFGRGVEKNVDMVIVVADPTYESFSIVEKVVKLCNEMGVGRVWAVLNKVQTKEMESMMKEGIGRTKVGVLGTICYDPEILHAGLSGIPLGDSKAASDVRKVIQRLEDSEAVQ